MGVHRRPRPGASSEPKGGRHGRPPLSDSNSDACSQAVSVGENRFDRVGVGAKAQRFSSQARSDRCRPCIDPVEV
jgi:hypothetical protein